MALRVLETHRELFLAIATLESLIHPILFARNIDNILTQLGRTNPVFDPRERINIPQVLPVSSDNITTSSGEILFYYPDYSDSEYSDSSASSR